MTRNDFVAIKKHIDRISMQKYFGTAIFSLFWEVNLALF